MINSSNNEGVIHDIIDISASEITSAAASDPILTNTKKTRSSSMKLTIIGVSTCLITFLLAFFFKDYFLSVFVYLDAISSDYVLLNLILLCLFIVVSSPFIWGYTLCVLMSSYIYSFINGFIHTVIYTTIGLCVSFFLSRYILIKWQYLAFNKTKNVKSKYFNAVVDMIEGPNGFKIILLARLVPLPFGVSNSVFAFTKVTFYDYMVASILGLIPTQLLTCYIGSTLKTIGDVVNSSKAANKAYFILFGQILITIFLMVYMLKMAKIELDRQILIQSSSSESQTELLSKIEEVSI